MNGHGPGPTTTAPPRSPPRGRRNPAAAGGVPRSPPRNHRAHRQSSGNNNNSNSNTSNNRQQKPKEEEWDAETILSTYTTTDNHPSLIRVARRPKAEHIRLDRKTGLPVGTVLPAEEKRLREAEEARQARRPQPRRRGPGPLQVPGRPQGPAAGGAGPEAEGPLPAAGRA